MLASTIVITLVVLGGVWVYRLLTGIGDEPSTAEGNGAWNRIALVNRNSGAVDIVDAKGEVVEAFDGAGVVQSTYAAGGTIVTASRRELRLVEAPSTSEPSTSEPAGPFTVDLPDDAEIRQLPIPGRLVLVVAEPAGGNLIIVDATNQRVVDVAAELGNDNVRVFGDALQYDRAAIRFAVADASTFRTAVVSLEGNEPEFHSGIPVAVGSDTLATQVVGRRSDVTVANEAGDRLASATTDVIADGLMLDRALIAVTDTADLIRLEPGKEAELMPLDVAEDATATELTLADDDSRLIVTGDTFVAVTDLDGEPIYTGAREVDDRTVRPEPQWRCLPVDADTGDRTVVSLATGTELHALEDQEIVEVSHDACSMIVDDGDGLELVITDPSDAELTEEYSLDDADEVWLAPDGRSVLRRSGTDSVELLRVEDGDLNVAADVSTVVPNRVLVEFLGR